MNTIIGQAQLVAKLATLSTATMPSALLLLGDEGSGKEYIATRFAKHIELELVKLTDQTSAEELIAFMQSPITKLYLLELNTVSEKAQNKFLKFIEEPSSTVKIILTACSTIGVLPTILNRCNIITLDPYSIDELKSFSWAPQVDDPLIYTLCNTPGKLNTIASAENFQQLLNFCNKLLDTFPMMSDYDYGQAMRACLRIDTKGENQAKKFDLQLFLATLANVAFERYRATGSDRLFNTYKMIIDEKQKILNKPISKDAFILSFLHKLWEISHEIARS